MSGVKPDTAVYALVARQDEFTEELWQYLNRRVSDLRVRTGRERAQQYAPLLARVEQDYGVDRFIILSLWGNESSYGDVVDNPKYMRPVIPALAALAYGEPRRRTYWEQELINALKIVDRGWANPNDMIGSWAGAMGHTQWMPEVWLNVGSITTGTAASIHSANPTTRLPAPRAIWLNADAIGAARRGAARSEQTDAAAIAPPAAMRNGPRWALCAPTVSRSRGRRTAST
jgi:Transglycosylase SLT domain